MCHYSHPSTTLLKAYPSCPLPRAPHCLSTPPAVTRTFPKKISSTSASHRSGWMLCQSPATSLPSVQQAAAKPDGKWQSSPCSFYAWKTTEVLPPFLVPILNKIYGNIKHLEGFPPLQSVKTGMNREIGKGTEKKHTACHPKGNRVEGSSCATVQMWLVISRPNGVTFLYAV